MAFQAKKETIPSSGDAWQYEDFSFDIMDDALAAVLNEENSAAQVQNEEEGSCWGDYSTYADSSIEIVFENAKSTDIDGETVVGGASIGTTNKSGADDWDLVSTASSVWTANTVFGDNKKTFRDVLLQKPRAGDVGRANVHMGTKKTGQKSASKVEKAMPVIKEEGSEGADNFGVTMWESQKTARSKKPKFRLKKKGRQ